MEPRSRGERFLSIKNLLQRRRLFTRGAHPKTLGTFSFPIRRKKPLSIHCHPRGGHFTDSWRRGTTRDMRRRRSGRRRRLHNEPTSFFQFYLQLSELSLLRNHLFSRFSVLLGKSLRPFRQLGQLLLGDVHLFPQLRTPMLFSELLNCLFGSRRRNSILEIRQQLRRHIQTTQKLNHHIKIHPSCRGHRRRRRSRRNMRRRGATFRWATTW